MDSVDATSAAIGWPRGAGYLFVGQPLPVAEPKRPAGDAPAFNSFEHEQEHEHDYELDESR